MKIKLSRKRAYFSFAIALIVFTIFSIALKSPLHAGLWDQINEKRLLKRLIGEGQFMGYQRNVDTKDPLFPLEVLNDGFKMIRVYQDFPGNIHGRMDLAGAFEKQVIPHGGNYL